jgi:hypothetical protein
LDSGPSFHWTEVKNKKSRYTSYSEAVKAHRPPLTGANKVPLNSRNRLS